MASEEKLRERTDTLLRRAEEKDLEMKKYHGENERLKKELAEITDEVAQQVFAFQARTKQLTNDIQEVEDEKHEVEEKLQSTQSLFSPARAREEKETSRIEIAR